MADNYLERAMERHNAAPAKTPSRPARPRRIVWWDATDADAPAAVALAMKGVSLSVVWKAGNGGAEGAKLRLPPNAVQYAAGVRPEDVAARWKDARADLLITEASASNGSLKLPINPKATLTVDRTRGIVTVPFESDTELASIALRAAQI